MGARGVFDEAKHPRGFHGRFGSGGNAAPKGGFAAKRPGAAAALFGRGAALGRGPQTHPSPVPAPRPPARPVANGPRTHAELLAIARGGRDYHAPIAALSDADLEAAHKSSRGSNQTERMKNFEAYGNVHKALTAERKRRRAAAK